MPYTEWPTHPDIKWMHTLEQQQMGLGEVKMNHHQTRQEVASLWAQKDVLQRSALAKRTKLKNSLRKGFVRAEQEDSMSRIAPPPPIPIPNPKNPVPGISPEAIVAVADLERKQNAILRKKIQSVAHNSAARANLAKRLKKVPGLTQMALNPRRNVKLPQPTWNYLATQGIITPGGIITPLGSYVEAGPSEAFGTLGRMSLQTSGGGLRPATTLLTTASAGLPAISQTPNFTGASIATQQGSSMAQASALGKECDALQVKVKSLEQQLHSLNFTSKLGMNNTPLMQELQSQLSQAKADMHIKCAQAQQSLADAKVAMAAPSSAPVPSIKRVSASPKVEVALPTTTKVTTALPDNTLITTAGGTIVTEAGDEPGIVLHPNGSTPDIIGPASSSAPPPAPSAPSSKLLPLILAAGVIGGGLYFAMKRRG
jgi:hypothetical protein